MSEEREQVAQPEAALKVESSAARCGCLVLLTVVLVPAALWQYGQWAVTLGRWLRSALGF